MADGNTLPTANDFFGSEEEKPEQLPTADEFFRPSLDERLKQTAIAKTAGALGAAGADVILTPGREAVRALGFDVGEKPIDTGPIYDEFFTHTAVGRIMDRFGQGLAEGWGEGPGKMTDETMQGLRELGILNDHEKGQRSLIKSFNEAFMRPVVTAGAAAVLGTGAMFRSVQGLAFQATKEATGDERLARDIAAIPEAFQGTPHPFGLPRPAIPREIAEAHELGVIGRGEAGWKGTAAIEDPKAAQKRYIDAYREWDEAREAEPPAASGPRPGEATPGAVAVAEAEAPRPMDVHAAARQIAPDVFERYDALDARRDTFRRWLSELDERRREAPRIGELDAEMQTILDKVNGVEDRLTKAQAARLEEARQERERLLTTDTADMRQVRQELQKTDYAMRDLAPQVSAAYREARDLGPEEAGGAAPGVPSEPAGAAPAGGAREAGAAPAAAQAAETRIEPEVAAAQERRTAALAGEVQAARAAAAPRETLGRPGGASKPPMLEPVRGGDTEAPAGAPVAAEIREPAAPVKPLPEQMAAISSDVSTKMIAAGRPAAEAQAAAQIIAARYATRAARFNGAKGTAEELYRAEGADIRPGRGADAVIREYEQGARGRVKLLSDGQKIITLMKDADASTFIHESGHVFLEEMVRDAADEAAPRILRDDMATVRQWLGADEGKDITRAQHEKFARGFERYLMEGRAPSAGLARVFEQFKDWLTNIYQSVAKLRSPISDDIRAVFDRLLAETPEPAIIAAEREAKPGIAQAHEALAERTSAPDALAVAQRIREEADAYARERIPELYDELYPEGRPEPSAGAPANAAGDVNAPRARSGAEGGGEEPGNVGARGDEAAAEGAGGAGRAGGAGTAATEVPARAGDRFDNPETPLVDKAGNIRLDGLNRPDDVLQAIRDASAENNEFQGARRGVVSDAQLLELADAAGVEAATLRETWQVGQAFNAENLFATYRLLLESATKVRDAAAKAADGIDADVMAYAEARDRHRMIQEVASGVTAEAGRALRAIRVFREMEGAKEASELGSLLEQTTGRTLYQLRREAKLVSKLETPQKVSKFTKDTQKATYGEMFTEYYVNALLSGWLTQLRNIAGNVGAVVLKITESAVAAPLGAVSRVAGEGLEGRHVAMGEARAQLYGILQGAPDAVMAAWKTFKNEEFLEQAKTHEQRRYQAIPSVVYEIGRNEPGSPAFQAKIEGMAINQARSEGLKGDKLEARAKEIMAAPTPEMLAEAGRKTIEIGGRQVRTATRLLGGVDQFFRAIVRRSELEALAWREATGQGLEGRSFTNTVADLVANPTEEMMQAAASAERYWTYQKPLGKTGTAIMMLANSHPAVRMVVTFVRTPINVIKFNTERSILGAFSRETRDNLLGKNGAAAADTQRARLVVGTAVGVATINMVMQGLITDGGPTDRAERAALRRTGWQPYAFKIGDNFIPLAWSPVGIMMGLYADTVRMWDHLTHDEAERVPALLGASVVKNLMNQSWLQGPANMIEAAHEPDRYGDKYVQNLIGGIVVPAFSAQLARSDDPYLREVHSILDAVRVRIPGLSRDLLPRRDVWGNQMLREQPAIDDPLEERLSAIGYFPAALGRTIRGVELTPDQYDAYAQIAGRYARMRLEAAFSNPQLAQAPVHMQRDVAQTIVDNARESARTLIMARFPAIIRAAVEDKKSALTRERRRYGPIKQAEPGVAN